MLLDELLALLGAGVRVGEDTLGLLVGASANLLGFAARLGQQRLAVGLCLLSRAAGLVCLFHAVAHALAAGVQHADNRLE